MKKADLIKNVNELKTVAEIGPGDSLGIGIAAIFTGLTEYYGFDVIRHANKERNILIANSLFNLFLKKNDIPNGIKYADTNPKIEDYRFPQQILGSEINDIIYLKNRLQKIADALNEKNSDIIIKYIVPWDSSSSSYKDKIDLIYSQAVMEHVENIDAAYSAMYKWLKPGGILSHQIDFKSHEMSKEWNGHWYINQNLWQLLLHGRKYSLNRLPVSAHINAIEKAGFTIKNVVPVYRQNKFGKRPVKVKGYTFKGDDYKTSSALIQALK